MKPIVRCFAIGAVIAAAILGGSANKAHAAEQTPQIIGQEEVIYLDGRDDIAVIGENIISVKYASDNTSVATVSSKGVVMPKKKGSAKIKATVAYRQSGKKKTKTLSYQLKVLENSTNYFTYTKTGRILRLKEKAKKLERLYIPGYRNNGKTKITAMYGTALTGNSNIRQLYTSDNLETLIPHIEDDYQRGLLDCPNLESIRLGKNFNHLGYLQGCPMMRRLSVDVRNESYQAVDNVLYDKTGEFLKYYPAGREGASFSVPETTKYIDGFSFYDTKNLEEVIVPDSILQIRDVAFGKSSIKRITLPKKADLSLFYGERVFEDCKNLEEVTLPEGVTKLDYFTFFGCTSLKKIVLPSTLNQLNGNVFMNCESLTDIVVPEQNSAFTTIDGVVYEKDGANLTVYPAGRTDASYEIPDGTKTIKEYAFFNALNLQSVTIPQTVTDIEKYAFKGTGLVNISIPSSVTALNHESFASCRNLTDVTLAEGLQSLGDAFQECDKLKRLTIPASVTSIAHHFSPASAFYGCTSLEEIRTADGNQNYLAIDGVLYDRDVKTIYYYPEGKKDESFTLPDTVKTIKPAAFGDLKHTKKLDVSGVSKIGTGAFSRAESLEKIILPKTMAELSEQLFSGCTSLKSVTLPDGVATIPHWTFEDCKNLKTVTIGSDVTKIERNAFVRCSSLKKLIVNTKKLTSESIKKNAFVETGAADGVKLILPSSKQNKYPEYFKKSGLKLLLLYL